MFIRATMVKDRPSLAHAHSLRDVFNLVRKSART